MRSRVSFTHLVVERQVWEPKTQQLRSLPGAWVPAPTFCENLSKVKELPPLLYRFWTSRISAHWPCSALYGALFEFRSQTGEVQLLQFISDLQHTLCGKTILCCWSSR